MQINCNARTETHCFRAGVVQRHIYGGAAYFDSAILLFFNMPRMKARQPGMAFMS